MERTECTWYFSEIYCWNVSSNKAKIYSLSPTSKPRRSRSVVFRTPRVWKVHWPSCSCSWLLSPEPKLLGDLPASTVEELIFSEEFVTLCTAAEQLEFIRRKLKVGRKIVTQISSLIVGQRNNPSWHLVRKGCLTASTFSSLINAQRVTPSLLDVSWRNMTFHFTCQSCGMGSHEWD